MLNLTELNNYVCGMLNQEDERFSDSVEQLGLEGAKWDQHDGLLEIPEELLIKILTVYFSHADFRHGDTPRLDFEKFTEIGLQELDNLK